MKEDASGFRFLLYSINYSPELTGIGKYNGEMAEWLAKAGCEVDVITAPPHYPEWKVHKGFSRFSYSRKRVNGVNVTRCPTFIPRHPNVVRRLIHLLSFAISSSIALFGKIFRKPDVVFVVQPTLFCVPLALLFCKLVGAKSILHIQDFEIDAMFGLELTKSSKRNRRLRFVSRMETYLLTKFDIVSSISYSMLAKARVKGVAENRLLYFPNWSDTEFINPSVDSRELRKSWGVEAHEKIVLYAGNIGAKQGLESVLDAAHAFQRSDLEDVRFFIVGEGAHSERLRKLAKEMGLSNLEFKPLQDWENVPKMLAMADVHLVVQRKGVADAVLPSKLTNILSAGGHAIVTADENTELFKIVRKYPGVYTCISPEKSDLFISAIEESLLLSKNQSVNDSAREYAIRFLNKDSILNEFLGGVQQQLGVSVVKLELNS
ncbi:MAG: WcaI family glycosyltransferase [Ketobacter sp.]